VNVETLADLVVNLRANFGDTVVQVAGFKENLKQVGEQAATTATVLKNAAESIQELGARSGLTEGNLRIFESVLQADATAGVALADTLKALSESSATVGKEVAEAASQLLDSMKPAADGATESISGFSKAAQEVIDRQAELEDRVKTAREVVDELSAAFDAGKVSAETLARAQEELERATAAVGRAVPETESALERMVHQLGALAAALAVTVGLKEFGEAALEAWASEERAVEALTSLIGSAKVATERIESLKEMALTLAVAEEPLRRINQQMGNLGMTTEQTTVALELAADASRATNHGFEGVSNMMSRMVAYGMAGGRQLMMLGISMKQLADAMGVATSEAGKTFKAMDMSERLEVLSKAMSRYAGLGEKTAKDLTGQWQNFHTQMEFVMQDVGKSMAEVATTVVGVVNTMFLPALRSLVKTFEEFPGPIKNTIVALAALAAALVPLTLLVKGSVIGWGALVALLPSITAAFAGLGITMTALSVTFAGFAVAAFVAALVATKTQLDELREKGRGIDEEFQKFMVTQMKAAATTGDFEKAEELLGKALAGGVITAREHEKLLTLLTASRKAYNAEMSKSLGIHVIMNTLSDEVAAAIKKIATDQEQANRTLEVARIAYSEINESFRTGKPLAEGHVATVYEVASAHGALETAAKNAGVELKEVNRVLKEFFDPARAMVSTAQALRYILDSENIAWRAQNEILEAAWKELREVTVGYETGARSAVEMSEAINKVNAAQARMNELMMAAGPAGLLASMPVDLNAAAAAVDNLVPKLEDLPPFVYTLDQAFRNLGLDVEGLAKQKLLDLIDAYRVVAESGDTSAQQVQAAWAQVSQGLSRLAKTDLPLVIELEHQHIAALEAKGEAQEKINQLKMVELQHEIKSAAELGVSASRQIIALTNLEMHMKALNTLANAAGNLYRDMMHTVDAAFSRLGQGIARAIIDFHNFGKNIRAVGLQIAEMFLTTLINAIMKWAESLVVTLIFGKAQTFAANFAEVMSYAALAAAKAFSAYAAIPFVGPALGAAAAGVAYGAVAAWAPLTMFKEGGFVPEDMLALIHAGEYVVPAHEVAAATVGGGPSGVTFQNCQFSGVTQELVSDIMNRAVKAARRVGAKL
jgi:hypothetical protein